jgi:hypothetical protein
MDDMGYSIDPHEADAVDQDDDGCTLAEFTQWMMEVQEQPPWRARADREADFYDGNQLDSNVLSRQRELGMPPAIEPLIGPTIDAVLGMEVKTRTDWRVIADNKEDEVAEALNYKLNQAERQSGADRACSEAYASEIKTGLGWVEVSKNPDPFKYPYRCKAVHRNEIWWDFLCKEPDLSDCRYLIRRRWTDYKQAQLLFPDRKDLIRYTAGGWNGFDLAGLSLDGGQSTALAMSLDNERGWSVEEQEWRDLTNRRVCLFEVWYKQYVRATVLKMPDGRVVEYDEDNELHVAAVAAGLVMPENAIIGKMRLSWWVGPHKLHDGPTPYRHNNYPYVPFWGKREDRTNVPYGLIRGMMYLQEEVNARTSKMQWMLSAVRVERTEGVVVGTDERFRQEVARPDADIILSAKKMAEQGSRFEVKRDAALEEQQYQRLIDAREGIKRVGGIYNSFMGQDGQAQSGVAISGLVEQSTQTLADINDNFKFARAMVGDLLLSLLIEDMIGKEEEVIIPGNAVKEDKVVMLNVPTTDDAGIQYLTNDIERTKLKVVLNDVPSTPSFRTQQLQAMSEAFKSMPPQYQSVALPHLLSLMDIPDKQDIIEAIKKANEQPTPEQIQEMIDTAVADAIRDEGLDIKRLLAEAKVKVDEATAVKVGVEGAFSAVQTGNSIAMTPAIAPIADEILAGAGYEDKHGQDPNFPQPEVALPALGIEQNTSPLLPPVPESPMIGIETARTSDNTGVPL